MSVDIKLKIASRSSDLARWQAFEVERHLKNLDPNIQIEMIFKSSFGDRNLELPLAQMESRGVFTEDFYLDLLNGKFDVVVHSWKDLPVEDRKGTTIVATLPRADVRDVLLVPKEVWKKAKTSGVLKILTSSPRRIYNLTPHLRDLLPKYDGQIEFVTVRGNIPSRVGKMWDQNSALILAKAALDRMMTKSPGFEDVAEKLQNRVKDCHFMVLPLSINPTAPAQGALAIEISETREDLKRLFHKINDLQTYQNVIEERKTLKSYGGGCHQKIGMTVLNKPEGTYRILKGLTDAGQVLDETEFLNSDYLSRKSWPKPENLEQIFPLVPSDNSWFERSLLEVPKDALNGKAVIVARALVPFKPSWAQALNQAQQIWTPGLSTWKTLAAQGHWVNGCFEGFGEEEHKHVGALAKDLEWVKLSHKGSEYYSKELAVVSGYQLTSKTIEYSPFLEGKKYFYWMSGSTFDRARELFPNEIAKGYHACGPGITLKHLRRSGIPEDRLKVFLDLNAFLKEVRPSR